MNLIGKIAGKQGKGQTIFELRLVISGLLTSIGKTSREALMSKESTKFVAKISVNSRCNRVYQK